MVIHLTHGDHVAIAYLLAHIMFGYKISFQHDMMVGKQVQL